MNIQNIKWHQYTVSAVEKQLHTNASCGLSRKEARSRYKRMGENTLFDSASNNGFDIFKKWIADPVLLLFLFFCLLAVCFLEFAAGISAFVCFVVGLIYAIWLSQTEKKLNAHLAGYRIPTVTVLRNGKTYTVSARNTVAGDILLLHAGDIVPCDCRLVSAKDLCVLTLHPDQNGKAVYTNLPKNADCIYSYGSEILPPYAENMLYGGSELTAGEAVAIAVLTAQNSFLGAMNCFCIPCEKNASAKANSADVVRPYLKFYSIAVLLFLFPLTAIGIFSFANDKSILEIILSFSSLAVGTASSFLIFHFHAPTVFSVSRCLYGDANKNRAVLKSPHAAKKLSELTDILVLGKVGISDGKTHLYGCVTGEGTFLRTDNPSTDMDLTAICQAVCIYRKACAALPPTENADMFDTDMELLQAEFIEASRFDTEALNMRLIKATISSVTPTGECRVYADLKNAQYSLLFSDDVSGIMQCRYIETNGKHRLLEENERQRIFTFVQSCRHIGCRIKTVAQTLGNTFSLIGVIAMREEHQELLPSVLKQLRQNGICTSFFLQQESAQELDFVSAAKLSSDVLHCTAQTDLYQQYRTYRIFVGANTAMIADLLAKLKKEKRRVAVFANCLEHSALMRMADLSVSCDVLAPPTQKLREELCEKTCNKDGNENSDRCAQNMRRHADVLVERAGKTNGGLSAVLQAVSVCRISQFQLYMLFRFFAFSQLSCLVAMLLSVLTGKGVLGGFAWIYQLMIAEPIGILWLLSLPIAPTQLSRPFAFCSANLQKMLSDKKLWLFPIIGTTASVLPALILALFGVISSSACSAYLFSVLLIQQLSSLFGTAASVKRNISLKAYLIPCVSIGLPALAVILLSVLFPQIHAVFGLGEWNVITCLLLVISIFLQFLFGRIFFKKFGRTAK